MKLGEIIVKFSEDVVRMLLEDSISFGFKILEMSELIIHSDAVFIMTYKNEKNNDINFNGFSVWSNRITSANIRKWIL